MTRHRLGPILLLPLLVLAIAAVQAGLGFSRLGAGLESGEDIFPSEAAVQFRMAREIAEGRGLPRIDRRLQWPEGVDTRRDMTLGIEHVTGWTWRLVGWTGLRPPFARWAVLVVSFLSALTAVPVFLLARSLVERHADAAGLVAAALWGLHPFASLRVVGNFGRENLALPFVALGFAGVALLLAREREGSGRRLVAPAVLAALGFCGALAFWHLSRTVVLVEFGLLWGLCVVLGLDRRVWLAGGCIASAVAVFSVLHPVLRPRGFAWSPGLVLGFGLLVAGLAPGWTLARRRLVALLVGVGGGVVSLLASGSGDSHVGAVVAAKLRHLFRAPSDPSVLPFEARALWLEAFNSPSAADWLYFVGPVLLVVLLLAALAERRRFRAVVLLRPQRLYLFAGAVAFGCAFALFFRLHSLWVVWLAAGSGALLAVAWEEHRRSAAVVAGIAALVFLGQTLAGPLSPPLLWLRELQGTRQPVYVTHKQSRADLLRWVRAQSPADAVFAGHIGTMAMIYADTDRAVALQPKWENDAIRPKVEEWTRALFADEQAVVDFCRRYGVTHLVLEPRFALEQGPGSLAYQAGKASPGPDDPAVVMHFQPLEYLDFELVHRNPHFQVYRFLPSPDTPLVNAEVDYEPVYDPTLFRAAWEPGRRWDVERAREVAAHADTWYAALAMAQDLRREGKADMARSLMEEVVRQCPGFHRAWALLGRLAGEAGDGETARRAFEQARLHGPATAEAAAGLGLNQ